MDTSIATRQVFWSGHVYGLGGYAKTNRAILFRLSKDFKIQLEKSLTVPEARQVDLKIQDRLSVFENNTVSEDAVLVRHFAPTTDVSKRYRICFTMMETEKVHPEFIWRLNDFYDEVWTPTAWNRGTFIRSGLERPCFVVPLGADPDVYYPGPVEKLPLATLLSTDRAGNVEVPEGMIYLSVFHPSFRKGLDVLLPAFEQAFGGTSDVALVLSGYPSDYIPSIVRESIKRHVKSSRVYAIYRPLSEEEISGIYRACHVYVSMSLGEGWDLPVTEAVFSGKPVIASRNTAHRELLDPDCCFFVDPEGQAAVKGAERIAPWYKDMPFSVMGPKSISQLVEGLRYSWKSYEHFMARALPMMKQFRDLYTWDRVIEVIKERLFREKTTTTPAV